MLIFLRAHAYTHLLHAGVAKLSRHEKVYPDVLNRIFMGLLKAVASCKSG